MTKKLLLPLLLFIGLSGLRAQGPFDPCDSTLVAEITQALLADGATCLDGAGPFQCIDEVFEYVEENCNNFPPNPADPCDSALVAQITADLIAQGFTCLEGAGPFACQDEVFEYVFQNCPPAPFDPCDSAFVAQQVECLLMQGYTCLEGAGPFNCVEEVFEYVDANCPLPPYNECDSALVAQVQADLIIQGFSCLEGAGPFACVEEIFAYIDSTCTYPPGNPCDSAMVAQVQADLIAQGFDCLEGAGPFACLDEVFQYLDANCPPVTPNECDTAFVASVVADLIAQGADCLEGAGPFACLDEVFQYLDANCPPVVVGDDCDSTTVAQTIDDMIAQGFDCLVGAGPFTCVHEVICYAYDNCPPAIDSTEIPACFWNVPQNLSTFQQFINWMAENCDSTVTAGLPQCWLDAPIFNTDEEYFTWLAENCEGFDSLMIEEQPAAIAAYFNAANTTSAKDLQGLNGITLSPNPAAQWVRIGLKNGLIGRVELSDVHGRVVYRQENVNDQQIDLNLENLAPGVYFARITDTTQQVATRKLVRQ